MIKEFNNEQQARALADSLGLFMTKCRGIYIVGSNKDEICDKYNMGIGVTTMFSMTKKYLLVVDISKLKIKI